MVFLGSCFSAVWIVVANSWQQTPAGYHIVGEGLRARAEVTDFWAMVFNPSSIVRLLHVWTGSFLSGAFFVLSVSAWYLLRRRFEPIARPMFKTALVVATFFSLFQLFMGDRSASLIMVIGIVIIGLTLLACFFWWRKKLFDHRWLLWAFVPSVALPQLANLSGWFTAGIGRQPWVVYGLLRTSDAFSKQLHANQIVFSLILFLVAYVLLLVLFIYLLKKKIVRGPVDASLQKKYQRSPLRDNPIDTIVA